MQVNKVFIITYCKDAELLYGSTLVFDSVRVGFPDSDIFVIDNASIQFAQDIISKRAKDVGGFYTHLGAEAPHWKLIDSLVRGQSGTIAFVDPDVAFFDKVRVSKDGSFLYGRYMPSFYDAYSDCWTMPRLHTSMMIVEDCVGFTQLLDDDTIHFEWEPWRPVMVPDSQLHWTRWDTGATIYARFDSFCHQLSSVENAAFEHLFCGSNVKDVSKRLGEKFASRLLSLHRIAQESPKSLRGAWEQQLSALYCLGKNKPSKRGA